MCYPIRKDLTQFQNVLKRIGGVNTKAYINRILHGENKAKKWEIIYWWVLRAVMVAAFIDSVL